MRRKITLVILCFSLQYAGAQVRVLSCFNANYSGRNISLTVSKNFGLKNEAGIGMRFNINSLAHLDDQDYIFRNRLYAREFYQYWGLSGYYQRNIIQRWNVVKPFVFYEAQLTHSPTKNDRYIPAYTLPTGEVLYYWITYYYGPFTWIEQNIGIGTRVKVTESFFVHEKIGFGTGFVIGKDDQLPETYDNFEWEWGGIMSVGLGYVFKSKKK